MAANTNATPRLNGWPTSTAIAKRLAAEASRLVGVAEEPQRVGEPAEAHDPRILTEADEVFEATIRVEVVNDTFEVDACLVE